VEFIAQDVDFCDFLLGDSDSRRVGSSIQFGMDLEAGRRGGAGDKTDDRLEATLRLASPVLADVGEQPMLDLVPLAGAGRKVTDEDSQAGFVG
jgi:hypothetical protein